MQILQKKGVYAIAFTPAEAISPRISRRGAILAINATWLSACSSGEGAKKADKTPFLRVLIQEREKEILGASKLKQLLTHYDCRDDTNHYAWCPIL